MIETDHITLRGVSVHNLKKIDVDLPYNKLVVITGLSGSGKSSLAFDTLFAEGQRRYVESLSSYARQFLDRMSKPDIDYIDGIPPAIAIQQKTNTLNPRSTVGTATEIYDYLKLLFARIGKTISPISLQEVKCFSVTDIVKFALNLEIGTKFFICFKYVFNDIQTNKLQLELLQKHSYQRLVVDNELITIEDLLLDDKIESLSSAFIVLDRLISKQDQKDKTRIADSVQTALYEGGNYCYILTYNDDKIIIDEFSTNYELDGIKFEPPTEQLFNFNSPLGACPRCEGLGNVYGIDENLVIPDKSLSIYSNAVACWRGEIMQQWKNEFIQTASVYDFPIHRPYSKLSDIEKDLLWFGNKDVYGLYRFFEYLEKQVHKIQYRVMLSRYKGKTICPECKGKRLKKTAFYVKINSKTIGEIVEMPINKSLHFFKELNISDFDREVSLRLLEEIINRLTSLVDVGLGYLSLNRLSSSLSGGEFQRINLASILGSGLVGALYVFDEPSIGLHSRDTNKLINVLKKLRDNENTVVVVEHDEAIIKAADYIIDMGPLAGYQGGQVVYQGNIENMLKKADTLTAKYLRGELNNFNNNQIKKWDKSIKVIGARYNNLKDINVEFPLNIINVVTGLSGSGKSSLVKGILFAALKKYLGYGAEYIGEHTALEGDLNYIKNVEYIDQNPIGKSSRSNPATYIKAYDEIRQLFASQAQAVHNLLKTSHFSFNSAGGRCETCKGEGEVTIEMQFMADINLICDACEGKRFKEEVLEVTLREKNIYDVLEMTIEEAVAFFSQGNSKYEKKIVQLLQNYIDLGLGYIKLGQPANTLSGGESQRIKLAYYLSIEKIEPTMFIFDEPTTGLHFYDITKLLNSFEKIREKGHSLVIIEHNPEVINFADWIIDLGPEGGENGGELIFAGTPQNLKKCKISETAKIIR